MIISDQNPEHTAEPDFKPNREHKDSVFSLLFSKPDILRELYSAIEGVDLPPDIPININTLTNALIKESINDISFLIDKRLVVLIEHQSTINENMALRILRYIDEIYRKIIEQKKTFRGKLIKIPTPEFIVLYNGEAPYPDKSELRLSDAFMDIEGLAMEKKKSLELVVQVYNINHGHNPEIQRKCETLSNYSLLIDKIREYQKTDLSLAKSIESAVKYCVGNNILEDFLKEHGSMISDILFQEYSLDDHLDARYQDGVEDGIEKGIEIGTEKGIGIGEQKNQKYVLELIDQGLSAEEIKQRLIS